MISYKPTRNVLEYAARFHRQLAERYRQLSQTAGQTADRKRLAMLLDYLQRHEKHFESALQRYAHQTRIRIRETWYQYIPESAVLRTDDIELRDDMSLDEVVEAALALDQRLVSFYRIMATQGGSREVRDIFSGLATQEEEEKAKIKQTAWDIQRL
jgi:bacterioferritin (cytochrome b1)